VNGERSLINSPHRPAFPVFVVGMGYVVPPAYSCLVTLTPLYLPPRGRRQTSSFALLGSNNDYGPSFFRPTPHSPLLHMGAKAVQVPTRLRTIRPLLYLTLRLRGPTLEEAESARTACQTSLLFYVPLLSNVVRTCCENCHPKAVVL